MIFFIKCPAVRLGELRVVRRYIQCCQLLTLFNIIDSIIELPTELSFIVFPAYERTQKKVNIPKHRRLKSESHKRDRVQRSRLSAFLAGSVGISKTFHPSKMTVLINCVLHVNGNLPPTFINL